MAIVNGAVTTLDNIKLSNPAVKDLDIASDEITGLKTDKGEGSSVANVDYVKEHVHKTLISCANKKDAFRYLMENVNRSSYESIISVTGINDFAGSSHQVKKKAYDTTFTVDGDYEFRSRLGFNIYKLLKASTPSSLQKKATWSRKLFQLFPL